MKFRRMNETATPTQSNPHTPGLHFRIFAPGIDTDTLAAEIADPGLEERAVQGVSHA